MDGFSYNNIFDTKGIEYLVIIAFLLLLIPFWLLLNRKLNFREHISRMLGVLTSNILKIPQGIFYSSNHTWTFMEKSGIARIGLDDLLVHITGGVKIHHLRKEEEMVRKGDLIAEIEGNGKSLLIYSPVSGKILKQNTELITNTELLTSDPYGKGWIYNIKPSDWIGEIPSFYLSSDATSWQKRELDRYRDFLATNIGRYLPGSPLTVLQDGGELINGSLSELPEGMWNDFQKEFMELRE